MGELDLIFVTMDLIFVIMDLIITMDWVLYQLDWINNMKHSLSTVNYKEFAKMMSS